HIHNRRRCFTPGLNEHTEPHEHRTEDTEQRQLTPARQPQPLYRYRQGASGSAHRRLCYWRKGNQLVASLRHCLYIFLLTDTVSHGSAQLSNRLVHRMIRRQGAPELVEKLLRADYPAPVLIQINQHIHASGRNLDLLFASRDGAILPGDFQGVDPDDVMAFEWLHDNYLGLGECDRQVRIPVECHCCANGFRMSGSYVPFHSYLKPSNFDARKKTGGIKDKSGRTFRIWRRTIH